ncbi:Heterogeneous nuclear ribonucleoprotein L [Dufourea novaeangliae]|uniref:Heterogeneous nuclear ribonucleoprotein L n=1 Tax=Dufourea novaeangliae TaxID=178035 RepID=A0A154NX09_DUFNO|nr:Heterogeneous nuclear ribonucleoprotein L [Dufourea novaeangliae]
MGVVMLECLSVCRCSLLVVDLTVMMDSRWNRGSTPQVTFPPGAGHDRYEENFNGPATYAEPYVERYGIKSDFSGREPLHPTPPRPGYVPTLGQTPPSSAQGSVMMVYGLQPDKVNTDKLFNLFCLYGNVTKVKFLKTKEGCAMIQMGDSIAVERCLQNLNNVTIGTDGRLQLGFSKQAFLSDVTNPYILPDKTASFKDFTGSKNNRFLNPAMANKNRIQPPSKIVHFFNTPPDLTEETVHRVFVERGIEAPTTVKLFPLKSERSSSGLIEFSSVGIAVAAIMECNHTALENSNGKFPYIMKLCFSSSRTIPTSFPPSSGSQSSNSAAAAITLSPVLPPPVPPPLPPACVLIATPTLYPTVPPPPPPPLPTFWPY